jgi:hypothetical protein
MEAVVISSSWLVVNGDVCTIEGRRWNGKKKGPRKKRGKPISEAMLQSQSQRAQLARERRRAGLDVGPRS